MKELPEDYFEDHHWSVFAECAKCDEPEIFWQEEPKSRRGRPLYNREKLARALEYCDRCPVVEPCLEEALQLAAYLRNDNMHLGTVWGGRAFGDHPRMELCKCSRCQEYYAKKQRSNPNVSR